MQYVSYHAIIIGSSAGRLTAEVDAIAGMLETVSANKWTLMDLSMRESALEEIYVKLMTNE